MSLLSDLIAKTESKKTSKRGGRRRRESRPKPAPIVEQKLQAQEQQEAQQQVQQDLEQLQQFQQQEQQLPKLPSSLGKTAVMLGYQQQQRFQGQGKVKDMGLDLRAVARQAPDMPRGVVMMLGDWLAVTMGPLGRVMVMDVRYPLVTGQVLPPLTRRMKRWTWRRPEQQRQRVHQVKGPIHNYAYVSVNPDSDSLLRVIEQALFEGRLPSSAYRMTGPRGVDVDVQQ